MSKDLRDLLARATARATATAASASAAGAKVLCLDDLRPAQEQELAPATWSLATLRGRLVELSARGATAALTTATELVLEAQRAEEPVAWIVPWSIDLRTASGGAARSGSPGLALDLRTSSGGAARSGSPDLAIDLRTASGGAARSGSPDLALDLCTASGGAARPGSPGLALDLRTSSGTFYPPDLADSGVDLAALVVVRAPTAVASARSAERLLRSGAFGLVVLDLASSSQDRLPDQTLGRLVSLAQAHDAAIVCITEKTPETGSLGSLVSLRAEALRARGAAGEFEVTIRALKDKRRGPGWTQRLKARGPSGL